MDLLPGEFASPALELASSAVAGNYWQAKSDITAGSVLLETYGFLCNSSCNSGSSSGGGGARSDEHVDGADSGGGALFSAILNQRHTPLGAMMWARLARLCPDSLGAADAAERAKFASDVESLAAVAASFTAAWAEYGMDIAVTTEELQLLQMRMDLNTFAEGLFPLASFFNHACRPNCAVTVKPCGDKEDGNGDEGGTGGDGMEGMEGMGKIIVRAVADVPKGTMMCISYLSPLPLYQPAQRRRAHLLETYRFECGCSACVGDANSSSLSSSSPSSPSFELVAQRMEARLDEAGEVVVNVAGKWMRLTGDGFADIDLNAVALQDAKVSDGGAAAAAASSSSIATVSTSAPPPSSSSSTSSASLLSSSASASASEASPITLVPGALPPNWSDADLEKFESMIMPALNSGNLDADGLVALLGAARGGLAETHWLVYRLCANMRDVVLQTTAAAAAAAAAAAFEASAAAAAAANDEQQPQQLLQLMWMNLQCATVLGSCNRMFQQRGAALAADHQMLADAWQAVLDLVQAVKRSSDADDSDIERVLVGCTQDDLGVSLPVANPKGLWEIAKSPKRVLQLIAAHTELSVRAK